MDRIELLNDPEENQRVILEGHQSGVWTALVGIVTKITLAQGTCEVQPAIQGQIEDENGVITFVNLPVLVDVPIVFPSAGGFSITFPLAVGDEVLVIFANRCIDAWWQLGGIQKPMESRMHDLSDGFAIPGPKSVKRVPPGIHATNLQIRNDLGTSLIEMTAAGGINITGNVVVTGTLSASTVTAGGKNLATHTHSGVTSGSGTSGPPV